MTQEVFTPKEAAEFLRFKVETLESYRVKGFGPRYRRVGDRVRGRVRYLREDLLEWLNQGVQENTSVPEKIDPPRRPGVEFKTMP